MPSTDLGTMEIDHVDAISNSDIINLVARIDLGLMQFSRTQSATTNGTHRADIDIINGWIDSFEQMFKHFANQPELFMPKAHPKTKNLPAPPVVNIVQNPSMQNLLYSLSHMRTELLFCESAERLNGFQSRQGEVVVLPWIEKFKAFAALMKDNVDPSNADRTWFPDADLQEPGVNVGDPR